MDKLIFEVWEKCSMDESCIIDFSSKMKFEWDKMYFFSSVLSLEEINTILGLELEYYTDVGDRVVFIFDNKIVYHQEWFYSPSDTQKGIIFKIKGKFLKTNNKQARFFIEKRENLYFLEMIDN